MIHRTRLASVLVALGALQASLLPACSSGDSSGDSAAEGSSLQNAAVLAISTALKLSSNHAAIGDTITATVTYKNTSGSSLSILDAVIAARPPGGSHAGGPYDDFRPTVGARTLGPHQTVTLTATRAFAAGDPVGTWDLYPTYQDASGAWHDGPDASLTVGGTVGANGTLSTRGNQIVDSNGQSFRIASIGWNEIGAGPTQGIDANVARMHDAGFNTIRVSWVNATRDDDLARIDQVVAAAKNHGLKVILDNHTNEPGHGPQDNWGAQQKNGLWYDLGGASDNTDGGGNGGTVNDAKFVSDWVFVAKHYAGDTTVIGFDVRNEPLAYGGMCTWGDGNFNTDIRMMYQRVGNAILGVDSGKLIIAEGPQNYSGNFAGTGRAPWGDLSAAGGNPIVLDVPNKVVYSIHDYPLEIAGFSPDNGPDKVALMNAAWGYLVAQKIAPVWIGEMGSSMQDSTDAAWAQTLVDYTNGNLGGQGGPTFGAGEKGIGTDWWAWGDLSGQLPDGTQNGDGSLRADQLAVYSKLR